jgi:predicted acylesterase/phospholipase RssA
MSERRIGVALSGGGHRATVFGIGALLALVDSRLNEDVVSISSVSGGSIANGVAMTGPDYARGQVADLEDHYRPALNAIAERGLLLGGAPATRRYVRALTVTGVATVLGLLGTIVLLVAHLWIAALIVGVATLVVGAVAWRLVGKRSELTEAALDAELLGDKRIALADQPVAASSVHHVICTTELQSGTSFFFSNRAVYGHQFGGYPRPVSIPVATAVQASACVPGAFVPRVIARSALGLSGDGSIVVVDGGVYDNMADEWEYGYKRRVTTWVGLRDVQPDAARLLVVVNGSAGWDRLKPIGRGRLATELAGLLRSMDVQYDVSTAHRRRALMDQFRDVEETRLDEGVFVQISASPFDTPARFAGSPGQRPDEFSKRAETAEKFLLDSGYSSDWWDATVKETSGTKTTLAKLGVERTAKLLEHAYVLTRVNLYVILGVGDLDTPVDRERFTRLARGERA